MHQSLFISTTGPLLNAILHAYDKIHDRKTKLLYYVINIHIVYLTSTYILWYAFFCDFDCHASKLYFRDYHASRKRDKGLYEIVL